MYSRRPTDEHVALLTFPLVTPSRLICSAPAIEYTGHDLLSSDIASNPGIAPLELNPPYEDGAVARPLHTMRQPSGLTMRRIKQALLFAGAMRRKHAGPGGSLQSKPYRTTLALLHSQVPV
jgi:hypothetical protein